MSYLKRFGTSLLLGFGYAIYYSIYGSPLVEGNRDETAQFLSEVYRPVTLIVSAGQIKKLRCENKLFKVFTYRAFNSKTKCASSLHFNFCDKMHMLSLFFGELFGILKSELLIVDVNGNEIDLENTDDSKQVYVRSNGTVPRRFMCMIHDFSGMQDCIFVDEYENKKIWREGINKISFDHLERLKSMTNNEHIWDLSVHLNIKQAPDYSNCKEEYSKLMPELETNIDTDISRIDKYYFENNEKSELIDEFRSYDYSIQNRIWYIGRFISAPVKIFIDKCKTYVSYDYKQPVAIICNETTDKKTSNNKTDNDKYSPPWNKYISKTRSSWCIHPPHYPFDSICGTELSTSVNFDFEEFVVLEEALKHQGAEFSSKKE
jgi:hypothetical protein